MRLASGTTRLFPCRRKNSWSAPGNSGSVLSCPNSNRKIHGLVTISGCGLTKTRKKRISLSEASIIRLARSARSSGYRRRRNDPVNSMQLSIRQAVPQVADILREAARWLEDRGIAMWRDDELL